MPEYWFDNALCLMQKDNRFEAEQHAIHVSGGGIAGMHKPGATPASGCETINASGLIAVPGFVNCHGHSLDNLARGSAGHPSLELWSLTSPAAREQRSHREIYVSTMLGAIEMMRDGITTALDHVRISPDIDAVPSAWRDSGMRAVIAPIVSDRSVVETMPFDDEDLAGLDFSAYGSRVPLPAAEQMAVVEHVFSRWHGGAESRIRIAIGPSGPQRCSDTLLTVCADFSQRHDAILHTHVRETRLQREMGMKLYGRGMIAHMGDLGR